MKLPIHALAAAVLCVGCQSSDQIATAPVSGTVTLDGKPVATGTVMFEKAGARPATGQIKDGKIVEVTTYQPDDGAAVGQHQVAIFVTSAPKTAVANDPGQVQKFDPNYMGGGSLIPTRYNDPKTSGLTAEVKSGGPNEFKFELTSK
jgi:hypothetical protein